MQNDPLSLWEIFHLLRINNAKWPSLTLRKLPFAGNQQCKVTLSHFENQKKSLRLTGGQWPLFCNISPDYHLSVITNHCTLFPMIGQWPWHCAILGQWTWHCAILSLTNQITWYWHHWVTPPKINQWDACQVTIETYKDGALSPIESSVSEFLPWFALPWACQP